MPKKRRKLDPEMEKNMASAKKEVELITAKINDISEEDIQIEYREAFRSALLELNSLVELYKTVGYTEDTKKIYENYLVLITTFLGEYEL